MQWLIYVGAAVLFVFAVCVIIAVRFFVFAVVHPRPAEYTTRESLKGSAWYKFADELLPAVERVKKRVTRRCTVTAPDGAVLNAVYIPSPVESDRLMVLVHGWHGNQFLDFGLALEYYLDVLHCNILLTEQRAHGESKERYTGFGYYERHDCVLWTEYAAREFGADKKIILGGISMGASTVLLASEYDMPGVKGIIADCGFTDAKSEFRHVLHTMFHLPSFPILYIAEIICKMRAGYGFEDCSTVDALKKSRYPVFFLHGTADNFVPASMSQRNYDACTSPKMLTFIEGAKHGGSFPKDADTVKRRLGEFLESIDF